MSKIIRKNFSKRAYTIFLSIGANQDGSIASQMDIAREFSMPITTINYHVTKFKQEGLINKYLELTDKGRRLFLIMWNDEALSTKYRAHNIQILFRVVKCPFGFPNNFSNKLY